MREAHSLEVAAANQESIHNFDLVHIHGLVSCIATAPERSRKTS